MKKSILLSLALLCLPSILCAQDKIEPYKSKWHYNPSFGVNIPIAKLFKDANIPSDYLFEYDDNYYYWQVISFSYFFHKHWGLELSYQAGNSNKLSGRADKFLDWMQAEYNDNYYVRPSTGASFDSTGKFWGRIQRGNLGVIYRMEYDRFLVYPKFGIGFTSFVKDWGEAELKEKNSNNTLNISYGPHNANDYFMLSASVMLGYKLSKRVYVNVDIISTYFYTDTKFDVVNKKNAEIQSTSAMEYKRNVFNLSLGAGLIIVLK